ncbi:phenoloxidase-activating factor 2-like [Stegodyphus dumicola]|uniref:phenoloxidase-activating factor 2-like n=1 Tax=Stegodyphus dumicola TaxID=202533 RepID=UPI0015A9E558|nr:phenoloxidase-activating factor 2-like [Stegodyphus dumicola]
MPFYFLKVAPIVFFFFELIQSQEGNDFQCDCMEYWECVGQGGAPLAYCDYSHKVCCFFDSNVQNVGILPKKGKLSSCGQKGADSGKDGVSEAGEWAWHVAILEKPLDLYVCGGSLLDEYWVLTAAHCVDDYSTARILKVRLGEHDVSSLAERHPHEEFDATRIVLHPRFNNETLENDIALLQLSSPVRRKPHINIICIPDTETEERELLASSSCYITGWGRRTESSNHSFVLKEVNVPIWRVGDCESALQLQFGSDFTLPGTSLCAGAEGRDACDGDGGGPLVCLKKSRWYQVGVISFGIGCGRRNIPGVYTRVQAFSSWIYATVTRYGRPTT